MKTYAIVAVRENRMEIMGSPILTCSMKTAIKCRNNLVKQAEKDNPNFQWEIWVYDIKTQGRNFDEFALAQTFKEPF